jgi:hypothetical protein
MHGGMEGVLVKHRGLFNRSGRYANESPRPQQRPFIRQPRATPQQASKQRVWAVSAGIRNAQQRLPRKKLAGVAGLLGWLERGWGG